MKRFVSFTVLVMFLMTSCSIAQSIPTQAPSPTSTPKPTATVTPTPDPLVGVIDELQHEGINVIHVDDKWKLKLGEVDIPGARLDAYGFTVQTRSGEFNVLLSKMNWQVEKVNGALVVKDSLGNKIAAWDPALATDKWSGRWVETSEAIWTDGWRPESYRVIDTEAEVKDLENLTLLLSPDFPANASFPPLDKVKGVVDYSWRGSGKETGEDFNLKRPFGVLADFSQSPVRNSNFVMLRPGEGRDYYTAMAFVHYLNIDKSVSSLKYAFTGYTSGEAAGWLLGALGGEDGSFDGNYVLPLQEFSNMDVGVMIKLLRDNYDRLGLLDGNRSIYTKGFRNFVVEWFGSGIMPEKIVNSSGEEIDIKEVYFCATSFVFSR